MGKPSRLTPYAKRVRDYAKKHGLFTARDVLAAAMMELEQIADDPKLAGTRTVFLRIALDAVKHIESEMRASGEAKAIIRIEHAQVTVPEGYVDPPELPTDSN